MTNPTPAEALKACPNPWCASHRAPVVSFTAEDIWHRDGRYRVQCPDCPIKGPHADSQEKAIAAWNTRALPSPATDAGEVRERIALNLAAWQHDMTNGEWPADKVAATLKYITSEHTGDCTKQPWPCMRCQTEEIYRQADQLLAIMQAPSPTFADGIEAAAKVAESFYLKTHEMIGDVPAGIAAAIRGLAR